jgi:hypothetical protein
MTRRPVWQLEYLPRDKQIDIAGNLPMIFNPTEADDGKNNGPRESAGRCLSARSFSSNGGFPCAAHVSFSGGFVFLLPAIFPAVLAAAAAENKRAGAMPFVTVLAVTPDVPSKLNCRHDGSSPR